MNQSSQAMYDAIQAMHDETNNVVDNVPMCNRLSKLFIDPLEAEIGRLNLLLNGDRKLSKCCDAPLDEFYSIKRKRCLGCGNWYNWPLGNKEPVFDGKHES